MANRLYRMAENIRLIETDHVRLTTQTRGENRPTEQAVRSMINISSGHVTPSASPVRSDEAGLAPGTMVMTLDGTLPVEFLSPGDRVITRRGVRAIKAISRTQLATGAPRVVVSPDALGGKPSKFVSLMAGQRVLIRDWRAKAMWGKEVATPPVVRLVDGQSIRLERGVGLTMLSLYFGSPEVIYADGLELASADEASTSVRDAA